MSDEFDSARSSHNDRLDETGQAASSKADAAFDADQNLSEGAATTSPSAPSAAGGLFGAGQPRSIRPTAAGLPDQSENFSVVRSNILASLNIRRPEPLAVEPREEGPANPSFDPSTPMAGDQPAAAGYGRSGGEQFNVYSAPSSDPSIAGYSAASGEPAAGGYGASKPDGPADTGNLADTSMFSTVVPADISEGALGEREPEVEPKGQTGEQGSGASTPAWFAGGQESSASAQGFSASPQDWNAGAETAAGAGGGAGTEAGTGTEAYSGTDASSAGAQDWRSGAQESGPTVDQPTPDLPIADQPVGDQPTADQPVTGEPVADQPVADQPIAATGGSWAPSTQQPGSFAPAQTRPSWLDEPATDAGSQGQWTSGSGAEFGSEATSSERWQTPTDAASPADAFTPTGFASKSDAGQELDAQAPAAGVEPSEVSNPYAASSPYVAYGVTGPEATADDSQLSTGMTSEAILATEQPELDQKEGDVNTPGVTSDLGASQQPPVYPAPTFVQASTPQSAYVEPTPSAIPVTGPNYAAAAGAPPTPPEAATAEPGADAGVQAKVKELAAERPEVVLAAAFAGGVLLATILRRLARR